MKKKLVVLLCNIMVLAMVGCGSEGVEGSAGATGVTDSLVQENVGDGENSVSKEENQDNDRETDTSENLTSEAEEVPEGLSFYYEEDVFGYSVYLPNAYNQTEGYGYASYVPKINYEGETDISDCERIYITQYSGDVGDDRQKERIDMTQYEDSTDIFDLLISNIEIELWAGLGYLLEDYSVEILETKEINGIEMTKFQGVLNVGYDLSPDWKWTWNITAWGIKAEGTPVLICAIDQTEEQSEHEYWAEKIDEIAATFRNAE